MNAPVPELGPRVLFFTGGTALADISRELTAHTYNSVHVVTPFDSGGSSASLRRVLDIPAVGDLRNRLLALSDDEVTPAEALALCKRRLPQEGSRDELLQELYCLASARSSVWADIPRVCGEVLRLHLHYFLEAMPEHFDPRGACIGNLILAGGWAHHGGDLLPTLGMLSRLFRIRGLVLPVVQENLHLAAELENGELVVGQHHITGRGNALSAPVRRLFLTRRRPESALHPTERRPRVASPAATYIRAADCICYPMGSFYTSLLANLLPLGVGEAVCKAECPKLYIPNSGVDPEQRGLSVADSVALLLNALRRDAGPHTESARLLHVVLVDGAHGRYPGGIDAEGITAQGVAIRDIPLVRPDNPQRHDPELTTRAILAAME
ncbi:MAG: GAK system CofD-like protein [Deltaproteobacteria bacterium]|jgi:CofD-related protein of GAK system|nr:GAK system CofD-like protein [Deltaproteobacteria bacterium]